MLIKNKCEVSQNMIDVTVILGLGKIFPLLPLKSTRTLTFHLYKASEGAPEDRREDKVNKVLTSLHLVM